MGQVDEERLEATVTDHPHTRRRAELIAERLRVLAQPVRVSLVERLASQATTVQELVDALETTQQNVSQHLQILQRAGILARHKEGTRVRYELVDPHVLSVLEQAEASLARQLNELFQSIESTPWLRARGTPDRG